MHYGSGTGSHCSIAGAKHKAQRARAHADSSTTGSLGLEGAREGAGRAEGNGRPRPAGFRLFSVDFQMPQREDPKDGRCGIERRLKGELATEVRWEDATLEEGNTRIRTFPLVVSTLGE